MSPSPLRARIKHAYPGRFLAASELEIIFGCMLMSYDIEMLDTSPVDILCWHCEAAVYGGEDKNSLEEEHGVGQL